MTAQNIARSLYPLLGVMVILTLWQLYTSLSGISPLVLPSPIEIASVCIERYDLLLQQTWPTFVETVLGFALALVIGIPLAVFVANSRLFNLVLYPILVATQSIPKVAIAPIILVWFGLGISSKLALAFLVAFFPIVVDTAAGLQATPLGLLELAHALCASRRQVFVKVQLPAALPFIFAGSKVAITLAVSRTIVPCCCRCRCRRRTTRLSE